ncbi:MAG: hypothetical protein ACLSTJ_02820 [Clostridium neonatale]
MDEEYYTRFGIKASGGLNFLIRCNLNMKELSYTFQSAIGRDLDYITIQLTNDDIESMKQYIIAKNFEEYRYKSRQQELHPYLDGWTLDFEGVTDSGIPIIQLSSDDYDYDIQPPVERLYKFLISKYFSKDKKYKSYYG